MLILLDIDGVMIPAKSWSAPPLLEDGFSVFNSQSVSALNEIIANSNAGLMLTTSHKYRFSLLKWKEIFKRRGVNFNGLYRLPMNTNRLDRLQEITNWYSTRSVTNEFVILDDDTSLNGLTAFLKTRLVLTKSLIGLNAQHVQPAVDILKGHSEVNQKL